MDYYEYYENTVNIEEATKEYETSVYKYKGVRYIYRQCCRFYSTSAYCNSIFIIFLPRPFFNIFTFFVLFTLDERDAIQKKTFTKWVNKHLIKVSHLDVIF